MDGYFKNNLWKLEYIDYSPNFGGSAINRHTVAFNKKATVKDLVETIINLPRSDKDSERGSVYVNGEKVMRFGDEITINHSAYYKVKDDEIKECTCGQEWCCFEFKVNV